MKKLLVAGILALALPLSASATTLTDLQTQLQVLMTQIATLQREQSGEVLGTTTFCPSLYRTLSRGSVGNDVKQLQQFLINQNHLAAGNNTGYFGLLTEAAVKQFQCKHMSLCSGSPRTNGYGQVGPGTRAKIAEVCAAPTPTPPPPPASCTFNGQPIPSGSTITVYQSPTVPPGSTCVTETRTCTNGVLSGSYAYATCTVSTTPPPAPPPTTPPPTPPPPPPAPPPTPAISSTLGGYFWGGYSGANPLVEGSRKLSEAGLGRVIRVTLSPRMRTGAAGDNVYSFDLSAFAAACPSSQPFLPCVVRTPTFQNFLALPGFSTIVLTVVDSASGGETGYGTDYVNPTALASPTLAAKVAAEYRDLTLALYETQRNSGKTFIVSNWETDNTIYCGESYSYITNPSFRSTCDAQTPAPAQKVQGVTQWFKLRQEGINAGKALAAQNGWTGVTVADGVQFNSYLALKNAGFKSVLYDVIPSVRPAYADYSAWESIQGATMDDDLASIKQLIAPHGSTLMIGEVGLTNSDAGGVPTWRFSETVAAAERAKPAFITVWEAYPATTFGDALFSATGSWTNALTALRSLLMAGAPQSSPNVALWGVLDRGVTTGARYTELYGAFPGSGYTAKAVCDGTQQTVTVGYESSGQINISMPESGAERWCTFSVSGSQGVSNAYGPRRICGNSPCAPVR